MTLLLQDTLVISPKTKQQVDKNTAAIAELQEKAAIAYHFKGSKPTFNDLPTTGNEVGDVWDVKDTGVNYGWTGTEWDELGPLADLEPYLTKEEATSTYLTQADATETYPTKIEVEEALKTAGSGYDALSAEQRDILLTDGLYNGEEVNDAEVFTQYDGKFVEFDKTLNPGGDWGTSSQTNQEYVETRGLYGNGAIIIPAGQYSTLNKSTDKGTTWTYHTRVNHAGNDNNPGTSNYCFNDDKFIGLNGGWLRTSTDGVNWSATQTNAGSSAGIAFRNGRYVTRVDTVIKYSDDGLNWSTAETPISLNFGYSLSASANSFMFVGGQNVVVSEDGENWTVYPKPSGNGRQCAGGNGTWVIVDSVPTSNSSNKVFYSKDNGATWNTTYTPSQRIWSGLSWCGDRFFMVSYNGDDYVYSFDGITWTEGKMPAYAKWYTVTYADGTIVVTTKTQTNVAYVSFNPFYEYALTDLSLNKTEVNTEISAIRTEFDTAVTSIMITAEGEPTTATVGALGQLYKDTATGLIYRCKTVDTTLPSYEWEELGSKVSGNFYRSLSDEQKTVLLDTGNYDDEEVTDGEIFTTATGTFVQYKIVVENDTTTRTLEQLSYNKAEVDALLNQAYVTTSWTIPLPVADWVENQQTFTIQGLTADSSVDLNPVVPTTREEMIKLSNAGLFISALGENSVTIECMNLPTEDLVVRLKREMTTNLILDGINVQLAEINGV